MKHTKTLKIRVKDKHCHQLNQMAKSVNFVWNYINELSNRSIRERGVFLSNYDMQPYTKGANKELGLHSQTVQCISKEFVTKRNKKIKTPSPKPRGNGKKRKPKFMLNWRKSGGSRRSLGWIPINTDVAKWRKGQVFYNGKYYKVWDSYGLSQYKFRTSSFNEDSRGRWYFNVVVEYETEQSTGKQATGIDLGCKEAATDSNGDSVKGREYRKLEQELGIAQRARNKKRVKAINAKIKNRRADALHKYSRKLVDENAAIFVGNVNSLKLAKTKMAKSVLDASWGMLKTMLEYKCDHAGIVFEEVNEAYTTQTCSCCGVISASSPKGRIGLRIREWTCTECGTTHDRDINAAKNILAVGLDRLAGEKVAANVALVPEP